MVSYRFDLYYDSGFNSYDSMSKKIELEMGSIWSDVENYLSQNGSYLATKPYANNEVGFKSYFHPSSESFVSMRQNRVFGSSPQFPKSTFTKISLIEINLVSVNDSVNDLVREILRVSPKLEYDLREFTGPIHLLREEFNAKYRD